MRMGGKPRVGSIADQRQMLQGERESSALGKLRQLLNSRVLAAIWT